jgi:hypothetical protein
MRLRESELDKKAVDALLRDDQHLERGDPTGSFQSHSGMEDASRSPNRHRPRRWIRQFDRSRGPVEYNWTCTGRMIISSEN